MSRRAREEVTNHVPDYQAVGPWWSMLRRVGVLLSARLPLPLH